MNNKKIIGIVFVSLFMICGIFAQTAEDIGLAGEWAKKSGSSEFFLNIDESTITYKDKKTEKEMCFAYTLQQNTQDTKNYPYQLLITEAYYSNDEHLEVEKLNEDFLRTLKAGMIVPIKLEKEVLTLGLLNKKNKTDDYKMIPLSKKDEKVSFWKKAGTVVVGVVATGTAAYLAADAIDDAKDNNDMQKIADECLEASLAY